MFFVMQLYFISINKNNFRRTATKVDTPMSIRMYYCVKRVIGFVNLKSPLKEIIKILFVA